MVSTMELLIPSASVLPSLPCSSSSTSPSISGRSSCGCSALERSSSSPSFTCSFPVRRRLIRPLRPGSSRRKVSRRNYLILTLVSGSTEKMPSSVTTDHDGDVATLPASGKMVFEPILEEGVFRFDCSKDDRHAAFPSFSFADQKVRETPISTHRVPEYVPVFESVDGKQSVKLKFPPGSSMYGTGEVSGQLERTGKRISTWNTDAWGYGSGTTSLYQSHPWVLVLLPDGKAVGILADTTRRCEVDLREACTVKFRASAPYPVITFGPLDSPTSVLVSLSHAIGTVFMPPKWSLGYHQCRFSYESEEKVMQIAKAFRKKRIPCDVIWMDIDYMDGFRCFTFDQESFPDPKSLARELHEIGFKAIWMLDPGIKKESGYFVYDSGCQNDVWVLMDNGRPFVGDVWPGPCVFPDYTQERTRSWWEKLVKDFVSNGVDGIWNDMNEPAVFKVVTKTMPETNIHRGDVELGGIQSHAHYHNVYGMLMARSTYEGMKMAERNKRPFVLTRAGFIGSQRYAATWTGDNLSNWEHLHMSLSMVLQLSLSGQPFSGPDIGGFIGNATPKLYARWMGIGALFPFCRGHSEKGNLDHEPWSFGEECEEVCRLALLRRYRFLPHIYSLFYMAHTKGTPVAVPAFFADPCNRNLRTIENSFLLGPLLICSSTQPDKGSDEVPDVLPRGIWLRFDFDDSHPDLPNLYLQGGSIVPMGPPVHQIRELKSNDDVTLLVSLDEHGKAEGFLYEDDGDGYSFIGGGYLLTYYVAELQSSVVTVKVSKAEGLWIRPKRSLHVCLLLGGGAMIEEQGIDGEDMKILLPSVDEVSRLVIRSEQKIQHMIGNAKQVPEYDNVSSQGVKLAKNPLDLKSDIWHLKVVPWVGGRMISMKHVPTGTQWLHSRVEIGGYEEYSGVEYRSPGCTEEYNVVRVSPDESGQEQSIILEGDISGGLAIQRHISIPKENPKVVQIHSSIVAQSVGAGSGGYSRLVCLRVHPQFTFLHPTEAFVAFVSINGLKHEIRPDPGEVSFEGDLRPNGEWMLVDKCAKLSLVNHFDISEVKKCFIYWGATYVNMELWSEERPVSVTTPINISHQYEVKKIL